MGDLKINETFTDTVRITGSTGVPQTGLTPTCILVKIADNTRTNCPVTELGSGWYKADITPNAAGTWATEWSVVGGFIIAYPFKIFKVGGGQLDDIATALTYQQQPIVAGSIPGPVQNQWYTILDTVTNARINRAAFYVATTGETFEARVTIDGQVRSSSATALTPNSIYGIWPQANPNNNYLVQIITITGGWSWEGRSIKIEIRKTTAAGNGTIFYATDYAKR